MPHRRRVKSARKAPATRGETLVTRLAGAIVHGAPLDLAVAGESIEVPLDVVDVGEEIYRVASAPDGSGLSSGDLVVVEPREDYAATAELVIASLADRLFIGRWWSKHGRRAVMNETLTALIEDSALRVVGAITVTMRYADR